MSPPCLSLRHLLGILLLAFGLPWSPPTAHGESSKTVPFVFTDIEGRVIRLVDYRGRWVLVNFWAHWCPLCRVEVPALNELNRRPDFVVIGIALDYGQSQQPVRDAIVQHGLRYHAIIAGGARRDPDSPFRQVGPVDFFPTSYLYDPTGEIIMFIPGQVRMAKVVAYMDNWRPDKAGTALPAYTMHAGKLAAYLKQHYGGRGSQAYADWKKLLDSSRTDTAATKLVRVNDFFNQRIRADEDIRVWGREEYWASPGEVLGAGRGDSEDFAIAKYFTLLAMNIPAEQLRLVYAKPRGETREAGGPVHVVVAWFESPDKEPVLLDNRVGEVLPASRRPDLRPVFSFNSLGIWGDTTTLQAAGDANRLAIWEDTLRRARLEGFE